MNLERKDKFEITPELIERLKAEVMLMEDELALETYRSFETAGAFNDPGLCEIASEVENFAMSVETFERMLRLGDGEEEKQ